jgi:hypothetical protein
MVSWFIAVVIRYLLELGLEAAKRSGAKPKGGKGR